MMSEISKIVNENQCTSYESFSTEPEQVRTVLTRIDWNGTKTCQELDMQVKASKNGDPNCLKFVHDRVAADIKKKIISRLS